MIERSIQTQVEKALQRQPAVGIVGPRQVGKTTLAFDIAKTCSSVYLDLESYRDREKLSDPILFFEQHEDQLIILDEIHRMPEIFQTLRGVIDGLRRKGKPSGHFLILGSASVDLLQQSGETLAGRIAYVDMGPISALEIAEDQFMQLWIRGGFPQSFLAADDHISMAIRKDLIRTYLTREISQYGVRSPAETLERLWMMLAHNQANLLNSSSLAKGLSIASKTVNSYIDLLVDLLLVRKLKPYHSNFGKRIVKSPKVYIRDSGILHALLSLNSFEQLAGHPVLGQSWEAFVIENILAVSPYGTKGYFYRCSGGAEVDLVLELPDGQVWSIETKYGLKSRPNKGFYFGIEDIKSSKNFVINSSTDNYRLSTDVTLMGLVPFINMLSSLQF